MLTQLKKNIKNHPLVWKHYLNRNAYSAYQATALEGESGKVLKDLKKNGIAFSNFQDFFPSIDFDRFCEAIYDELANYESQKFEKEHDMKSYFNFVLGLHPTYQQDSLWNKIASHPNLRAFSDAYFQMKGTEMRYYNIWKHDASKDNPKGSQLWHRDREDLKILKVFICIEDVDEDRGPFTYAPSTHLEGNIHKMPEYFSEHGTARSTDDMMSKVVPKNQWIRALGKKSTIVFADTHGYHKGGEVEKGYRLLFTTMYVSPACERMYFSK